MSAVTKAIGGLFGYDPKAAAMQKQQVIAQNQQAAAVAKKQQQEQLDAAERLKRLLKGKIGLLGFGESGETGVFGG